MTGERQPRVRVGVVVIRDENILLVCHRKADRRYWMLPGGGLQWGETLAACGVREVREETGIAIEPGRLLFIAEAIDPSGRKHVVNMVMLGQFVGGSLRCPTEEIIETVEWCPISQLGAITLYPPIAERLVAGLSGGFAATPEHLGSMWAD
jgi:ADP-ribose pyrophosphatase YjhB (NUDIX family)